MDRNIFSEARIVIPADVSPAVRAEAEASLLEAFGGFTRQEGYGAWLPGAGQAPIAEPVFVYDIACAAFMPEATASGIVTHEAERSWMGASGTLTKIASRIAREGAQECVYLRHPSGEVCLIGGAGGAMADAVGPVYRHAAEFWRLRGNRGY